jgi:hypothetical protein
MKVSLAKEIPSETLSSKQIFKEQRHFRKNISIATAGQEYPRSAGISSNLLEQKNTSTGQKFKTLK